MKALIVVDMQNDFIDGALGTSEAQAIVPKVTEKIAAFDGAVICTRDTHGETYLDTLEGKNLPVAHCIRGTQGHQIHPDVSEACEAKHAVILDKPSFGSPELAAYLKEHGADGYESIELIGLCTDICVISNALLLKAYFPETPVVVDASCCAGVTPESHENALSAMRMCQVVITDGDSLLSR